jgi:hypothetical protein
MGSKLTFEVSSVKNKNKDLAIDNGIYEFPNSPSKKINYYGFYPVNIDINAAKSDLTLFWKKNNSLDLGLKITNVKIESNSDLLEVYEQRTYRDSQKNVKFNYAEYIPAGYINYKHTSEKFTWKAGLRFEYSIINQETRPQASTQLPTQNYLNLFPTVSLEGPLNKIRYQISYAKRVERPNYGNLNPNLIIMTSMLYYQGNPFLKPEYIDVFDATFQYKKHFFSFGYTRSFGKTEWVTKINDTTKVSAATYINGETLKNLYFAYSRPIAFSNFWTANLNLNMSYNHISFRYLNDTYANSQVFCSFKLTQNLKLSRTFSADIFSQYNLPYFIGLLNYKSQALVNIGLQKTFSSNTHALKLTFTDIFATNNWRYTSDYLNIRLRTSSIAETRQARLTYTYNFGTILKNANTPITTNELINRF